MSDVSVSHEPVGDVPIGDESNVSSPAEEMVEERIVDAVMGPTDEPDAFAAEPQDVVPDWSTAEAVPPPVTPPSAQPEEMAENDRLMAALAYLLWFIGPAIILLSPNLASRRYQRYHAVQGLGLAVVLAAATLVIVVMGMVMCCVWVLLLIPLGATVYCTILAYEGKYFKVPVLTNLMVSEGWLEQV